MSKAIENKQVQVQEITEKFQGAASVVVVDYRGLNVAQVTELRKQLREAGVEFKVYKNTLTRRAAEAAGLEGINDVLVGPNAIAFSNEDVVAPAKIINEKLKLVLLKVLFLLLKMLKHLQNFHHAKVYFLCFYLYFKLQCVTSHLQQKLLQNKKKNKALNNRLLTSTIRQIA